MGRVKHSVVLLFAGQGAQEVGMASSLASDYEQARLLIERADCELGKPLSRVMFSGPAEELTRTSWCQPALYVHGLACWEVLKERCPSIQPAAAAGLSLGEFTAHAAAGTFDFRPWGLKTTAGMLGRPAPEAPKMGVQKMVKFFFTCTSYLYP